LKDFGTLLAHFSSYLRKWPYDFVMLTGLEFGGELLVYRKDFHMHRNQLFQLFGRTMESIPKEDRFIITYFLIL